LHRVEQIVRKTGIHLHGEFFSAGDLFFLTHDGIPNAHWLCGCSLEVARSENRKRPAGVELRDRALAAPFAWPAHGAGHPQVL
jgi:hypothetical protein